MLNQLITMSIFIVEIVAELYVFLSFMKCNLKTIKRKLIFFCSITLLCSVVCIGIIVGHSQFFTPMVVVVVTIPSFFIMLWASEFKKMKFIVTYCLSDLSVGLLNLFGYLLGLWIFGTNANIFILMMRCIMMIGGSIAFSLLLKNKYQYALESLNKGWGILALVSVMEYVLMTVVPTYPTDIYNRPSYIPQAIMIDIFLFVVLILMVILLSNYVYAQQKKSEKEILATELNAADMQFQILNDYIDKTKVYRHDLKHHTYVLYNLCQNKKYDELLKYLESMVTETEKPLPIYSKNYIVNILFGFYTNHAQKLGIDFICKCNLTDNINIKDEQLTSLLGNALSNAFEECERIPDANKKIAVAVLIKQSTLMLSVQNTCLDDHKENQGALISNKGEGHGIGINSMKLIAKENKGILQYKIEKNTFYLKVVIPM